MIVPSSCCSYTTFRISPTRRPGLTPSASTCRPSRIGAGGRCSTPSRRARVQKPIHGVAVEAARGAAETVGFRQPREQFEVHFLSETPERAVADLLADLEPHSRLQVLGDQAEHLRANVVAVDRLDAKAVQKRCRRRHPLLLVIHRSDSSIKECRGRRLPQVVTDRAKHDGDLLRTRQVVDAQTRLVDDLQGMDPNIALRMPLRLLRASDQGAQFWKKLADGAEIQREREAHRRPRGEEQLLELSPDPLGRQIVERDRPAQGSRVLVELEVESRGELHRTQHAQAVLGERGRIDGAKAAPGEVGAAVERVDVPVIERIPGDRIHREIATARGFGDRHGGIASHVEAAVPAAGLRFPAGQRDVNLSYLVDLKALADRLHAAESFEKRAEGTGCKAEDLDVDVLGVPAEQSVAHPPANDKRTTPGLIDRPGNLKRALQCG